MSSKQIYYNSDICRFSWRQTTGKNNKPQKVKIYVPLPPQIKPRDFREGGEIRIEPTRIYARIKGEEKPLIDEELFDEIIPSYPDMESWKIKYGCLVFKLVKKDQGVFWKYLFQKKIDPATVSDSIKEDIEKGNIRWSQIQKDVYLEQKMQNLYSDDELKVSEKKESKETTEPQTQTETEGEKKEQKTEEELKSVTDKENENKTPEEFKSEELPEEPVNEELKLTEQETEQPAKTTETEAETKTEKHDEEENIETEKKTEESKTEEITEEKTEEKVEGKSEEAKIEKPDEELKSEETKPEETKSEETKSEELKTEETKSEEIKSEELKPEETKTEETTPEELKTEETTPEETKPEETKETTIEENKPEESLPLEETETEVVPEQKEEEKTSEEQEEKKEEKEEKKEEKSPGYDEFIQGLSCEMASQQMPSIQDQIFMLQKAYDFFSKAAAKGHGGARLRVAQIHLTSAAQFYGVRMDASKAFHLYKLAAVENNLPVAQHQIGFRFHKGVLPTDQISYIDALACYVQAALKGHPSAAHNIGTLFYEGGYGIEQNYQKAIEWWKLALDRGFALSAQNLGVLYLKGQGVEKNIEMARAYFKLAHQWDPNIIIPEKELQEEEKKEGKTKTEEVDDDAIFQQTFQEMEQRAKSIIKEELEEKETKEEKAKVVEKPTIIKKPQPKPQGLARGFFQRPQQREVRREKPTNIFQQTPASPPTLDPSVFGFGPETQEEEEPSEPGFLWKVAEYTLGIGVPLALGYFIYKRLDQSESRM